MALPAQELSSGHNYRCTLPGVTLLSGRRDGELSDGLRTLKEDIEKHFVTPGLLDIKDKQGNLMIFTDSHAGEFELIALGQIGGEKALSVTFRYPTSYGEIDGSEDLEKYGFQREVD
jgi:hypothetical protein